ncbi:MAG TPA: thioredoxin [Archangium sp.]|uniref:Thioredoxin n=1 Tax=Archangium gephyra TaxID=48 RepID=A0AAC8QDU5_9BACT|nr:MULTISPECIES: thioredoxin [Archangium]AKJ05484.1 Thioredoxin [Archangium gephyra]REG36167.1 thioredoxin [Archangium gephyra]HEX5752106.1 thioredoxin [Archangium sp.]
MAGADVMNIGDAEFDKEVLKSDQPVLVDFWATWCAPCRAIAPAIEELATQYKGKVKVAKIDIDNNQQVAEQYGIRSIPTLLIFKNGAVAGTIVGALPKAKIEAAIQKVM